METDIIIGDFLSVAEKESIPPPKGKHYLKTNITDTRDAVDLIKFSNQLGIMCGVDWGMDGLRVLFSDRDDMVLFKVSYPNQNFLLIKEPK